MSVNGVIYQTSNNRIIATIEDVQQFTETDITGKNASVKGIDLSKASFCILESTTLKVGDTLGTFTDVRGQILNADAELANAIQAATTLDELKKALIGTNGKLAKVVGKMKNGG